VLLAFFVSSLLYQAWCSIAEAGNKYRSHFGSRYPFGLQRTAGLFVLAFLGKLLELLLSAPPVVYVEQRQQIAYLLGLLAQIKCSICSYQYDN